jgi:hypothetical protein
MLAVEDLYEVECVGGPEDGLRGVVTACKTVTFETFHGAHLVTATYAFAVKDGRFYLKYLNSHSKQRA